MRYKILFKYKGNGIALNSRNQVLFSRTEYGTDRKTTYFLATGKKEVSLPVGFVPKLLSDRGEIIGLRADKLVAYKEGQFQELGSGEVYDCNCDGLVVGSTVKDGKTFPCLWDSEGIKWIGENPGVATAINDHGDMVIVETDDFCEYCYDEEYPFEVVTPTSRSYCIVDNEWIPLLGLDGQTSRVKAMDIDNDRRIVGYSLHSSPHIEALFGSEYGIPYFGGAAGHKPILWTDFVPREVKQPKYSIGATADRLGPDDTILGSFAEGAGDLPTCLYLEYEDNVFWARGDDSQCLDSVIWDTYYLSSIHGVNESGHLLASNPSCQELVLFWENHSSEQDYKDWERGIKAFISNGNASESMAAKIDDKTIGFWSSLRRKRN